MEINAIGEALKFMVLGMGVVFLFLYIMVLSIKVQAAIIKKYFPLKELQSTPNTPSNNQDEKYRVAASIAAVIEFCKNKSQKGFQ